MSKAGERELIHRVPKHDEDGHFVGCKYFPTITEAEDFAKKQMKELGHKGYTVESIPGYRVCEILEKCAPLPEWYRKAKAKVESKDE